MKALGSYLPVCRAMIAEDTSLYRARVTGDPVGREADLSYVPKPGWIRDFGRVNAPGESIFYSADNARTAVAEVLYSWLETAGEPGETRRVFVGRWITTRPIPTAVVPYHEEALALSPRAEEVRRQLQMLQRQYKPDTWAVIRQCLRYLGSEYARPAASALDYWVSTAYFNFTTNPFNFEPWPEQTPLGLSYPSVQMKFYGNNFATFPHVVDEAMHFVDAQALCFRRLPGGRFSMEGRPPLWFAKRRREFAF